jgi:hypothetical protein
MGKIIHSKNHIHLLVALLILLVPTLALASVGPPIEVTLLGDPRPAVEGEIFSGELEFEVGKDLEITYLEIQGKNWSGLSFDQGSNLFLVKGQPQVLIFSGRPGRDRGPLEISFLVEGRKFTKTLDLSKEHFERVTIGSPTAMDPGSDRKPTPGVDHDMARPEMSAHGELPVQGDSKDSTVRVHGRFAYHREDGVLIGADGVWVRIYDEDFGIDDLLGEGVTDAQGYYDMTVHSNESSPDLYVKFELDNSVVVVQDPTWGRDYNWSTPTSGNFSGSDWNVGTRWPGSESDHPAVHIFTDIVRTWRWALQYGYDTPFVETDWPEGGDGAWYTSLSETIHITHEHEWRESTHSHEYGHHFIKKFATLQDPDYCNNICDDDFPDDCGHCLWCEENSHDAWNEGFPNWYSDVIPDSYASNYGIAALHTRDFESLSPCGSTYHDPEITEGFMTALLLDIFDSNYGPGDDHAHYPGYYDLMTLDAEEILLVTTADHPLNPYDFLFKFMDRYPGLSQGLWFTAMNCGYDCDRELPTPPTNLASPSHPIGSDLADPTVEFTWTRGTDDASGIAGYSYRITLNVPSRPDAVMEFGNMDHFTTPPLSPGTYYFSIRSVDHAGNWDDSYAAYGPFTIHEAEPTNLVFNERTGWDFPMVPSSDSDNSSSSCSVSDLLLSSELTYWNISGRNDGEVSTGTPVYARVMVDGEQEAWCSWGPIPAGGTYVGTNLAPVLVRPGRHTFSGEMDHDDSIPESNESDNLWGHQFIWTPHFIEDNAPNNILTGTEMMGGWDSIVDGSIPWYNCYGLQFNGSGYWNALAIAPLQETVDLDVRLHNASEGSEDGYASNLGWSGRGAGLLDAVLVNRNTMGLHDWDAGVLNWDGGNHTFGVHHVTSALYQFPDSTTVNFPEDQYILLREFQFQSGEEGNVLVNIQTDPPVSGLVAQWLDKTYNTGDLMDYEARDETDSQGWAQFTVEVQEWGYYCLVLYRDPTDGGQQLDITLEVQRTPPDLAAGIIAGWHSPFVPLPEDTGTPTVVALPDTLHGNTPTWFNTAVSNLSPTSAANVTVRAELDGEEEGNLTYPSISGYYTSGYNWNGTHYVRGGRHTLAMIIDQDNTIEEISETNNIYGEQYVWSPMALNSGDMATRLAPPDILGGWTEITSGEAKWYNADGLRAVSSGSWWGAVAAMPGSASDVDIRWHTPEAGVKDGFQENLARSSWGMGQSDFLLINFNLTAKQDYDFGALKTTGDENFNIHCLDEIWIGTTGEEFGPYTLASGEIMTLLEFQRPPGTYIISLENTVGNVDWGLSVFPGDLPFMSKTDAMEDGMSWLNSAGGDESVVVEITEQAYQTIAIWKVGHDDLSLAGSCIVRIQTGLSSAGDDLPLPLANRLAGIFPNPFNPSTTVRFELASESRVQLDIYDLAGKRVRQLMDESKPAGRHQRVWDGRDDRGAGVASGVYMVRFQGGEARQLTKAVLIK